jgi:hypothetical protein
MRRLIKAWLPRGSTPESRGLTVPYSGQQKMTRQLFEMILKSRLRKLIDQDQQEAYNVLSRSPEYNPRPVHHSSAQPAEGLANPDRDVRPDADVAQSNRLEQARPKPEPRTDRDVEPGSDNRNTPAVETMFHGDAFEIFSSCSAGPDRTHSPKGTRGHKDGWR